MKEKYFSIKIGDLLPDICPEWEAISIEQFSVLHVHFRVNMIFWRHWDRAKVSVIESRKLSPEMIIS